jgi:hypothetical protein
VYSAFIDQIRKHNDQRRFASHASDFPFLSDAIITFNYDVMIDYAAYNLGIPVHYVEAADHDPSSIPLLKIHGSTNWARCTQPDCKNQFQPLRPAPPPYALFGDEAAVRFDMVGRVMSEAACQTCKAHKTLEPIIIPPTWAKDIRDTPLPAIWNKAVSVIREAQQIIVIGYSMPVTDTFFQYLLTLGLSENPHLNRVVIVNPAAAWPDTRDRYRSVFSRSLADRNRLNFLTFTFSSFLQHMVQLRSLEWPASYGVYDVTASD